MPLGLNQTNETDVNWRAYAKEVAKEMDKKGAVANRAKSVCAKALVDRGSIKEAYTRLRSAQQSLHFQHLLCFPILYLLLYTLRICLIPKLYEWVIAGSPT